jgi:mRNA interferase HigB
MRVIAKKALVAFWTKHPDARGPLNQWWAEAKRAAWKGPNDIKERYASASIIGNSRVVFNIGGNKYRLVVVVLYKFGTLYIRFVGTHAEYDRIDAEEI